MFRINLLQSYKVHDDGRLRREINNVYFYPYSILYYTTILNITNTKYLKYIINALYNQAYQKK